ncbi:Murein tetrapeptide carboxypeptidase [Rickettsiales bacterium Ac37b]|nr:Murein tetrapeptide carboxypeptidase [Rickettsiales bacterium Ac37b]
MYKNYWKALSSGDIVDIIAPAKGTYSDILKAVEFLKALGLTPRVDSNLVKSSEELVQLGYDPFCSNTDEERFKYVKNALLATDSKAVWAVRGGYGCSRIVETLNQLDKPMHSKLLIGFSDITVLHLFVQQKWQWPSLHADCLVQLADKDIKDQAVTEIRDILFANKNEVSFIDFNLLNENSKKQQTIEATITGGNLCLIETSIGTSWQIDTVNKILLLEDIGERGYSIDRSLEHLKQAKLLEGVKAVILGSFTESLEKDGTNLAPYALQRFANNINVPVIQINEIGHVNENRPIPFGTSCVLRLGNNNSLICNTDVEKDSSCFLMGKESLVCKVNNE